MTCGTCRGKGLVRVNWSDAPHDFALCLCSVGADMRRTTNAGKDTGYALWQAWCAREQVDPSRLFLLEEVLTPAELQAVGFTQGTLDAPGSREAALLAQGKGKPRVRL